MASTKFNVGDYVWITPISKGEFNIECGAKILSIEPKRIKVKDDSGDEIYITHEQVQKSMHITSIKGVEDMINLGDLQEYAILRNLQIRYTNKLIYTYTGTMLVAINPYEVLPLYTNAIIKQYKGQKIGDLPPHIFAIGDGSYYNMMAKKKNQCIVISGESGAGKTESTKLILQYLASINTKHSWIEQQILEANPILEAFGNAKTVRNDNSSRFGKYIDIHFSKSGTIEGAKIDQYLLEKSRIVSQSEGERNYHIFYSMLEGLTKEEKKKLDLSDAPSYNYLNGGKSFTCQGRNEVSEFSDIKGAFKVLNFSEMEVWNIYQLLAAVLHLGNLKFKSTTVSHMEASEVSDQNAVSKIAAFLGTTKFELSEGLTKRSIVAHGEKVVSTLTKDQASESRHAFVKGIYGKLFIFIVEKINLAIYQPKAGTKNSIGVLDIFGFENFTLNSFEQLCINFANETLQQFFVQHIFKMEQDYYTKEGINWKNISFIDNQEVLDILAHKPMNILALIDEESKFPKGTDFSMLVKLNQQHGAKKFYLKSKSDLEPYFGVVHFAGKVNYHIPGFLEKNRDTFSQDLKDLIENSNNDFLKTVFSGEIKAEGGKRNVTLSNQFKTSLDGLMKTLSACHPFFVRTIKPNEFKKPLVFDRSLCCRQLRYSGMMETAKIRQAGYPIRHNYSEFVNRFRYLAVGIPPAHKTDCREATKKICSTVFTSGQDYQLGHTKLFLKDQENEYLEQERRRVLGRYVIILQKNIRGWICRRRYKKMKAAAIVFQKNWRARGYRSRFLKIRHGIHRLQASILSRQSTHTFVKIRKGISKLTVAAKGYLARNKKPFGQIVSILKLRKEEEIALQRAGNKNYKHEAEAKMQRRLAELNREYKMKESQLPKEDDRAKMVDNLFEFLDTQSMISPSDIKQNEAFMAFLNEKSNQRPYVVIPDQEEEEEDLSEYTFKKFAATYFVKNVNPSYSRKPMKDKESLLDLPTPDDIIASQALWMTILRFMGDLPDPIESDSSSSKEVVMTQVSETLSRSFTNRREYQEILKYENKAKQMGHTERQKLISMTLKRKNKLLDEVRRGLVEDTFATDNYKKWLQRKSNNLEKIHFIIGHGILRQELRDEIFCQICKQITNNPSKSSHARGWILLSLCVGCFSPSQKFMNYLRAFIRDGPPGYAPYCEGRLNRTFKNGTRTQPPSWLELQATRTKEPINLQVEMANKANINIVVDSSSTSEEVCTRIASELNLNDVFGFSLFITAYDKVMSLGSENDHVMDAISQCEQYAKEQGKHEKDAPWRLFYRKEIFTPWHDVSLDPVATDLIYHQVIRGFKYGEYRCRSEGDIAAISAQQYYIENGPIMNPQNLHANIGNYIPVYIIQKEGGANLQVWEQRIMDAFNKSASVKHKKPALKTKEDIVRFAKQVWVILFSRFFEAIKVSGPELPKNQMIIAVNWTGLFMFDNSEQILMELSFYDLIHVGFERNKGNAMHNFTITTLRNEHFVFQSPESDALYKLVINLLDGLKKRSTFVVAMQDYESPGSESFLKLRKGDLITLANGLTGEQLMSSSYGEGECNGRVGTFPTEFIHILPCLHKPPSDILRAFKKDAVFEPKQQVLTNISTLQRLKLYTLSHYAEDNFREGRKITTGRVSVLNTARRASKEELWKYTNEPLVQPLLKKVLEIEELSKKACISFINILKYMGDALAAKPLFSNEYTNLIFEGAMNNDLLKDEVYCQIMKQLTFNRLSNSEERGWDLMYLATGIFAPSANLQVELEKFLQSRTHPLAESCLRRLTQTKKIGQRKYPPSSIEVEAIQHRSLEIYHKVYFPDDTDEAIEIHSMMKASDLVEEISERLGLTNTDGFSIFVKVTDKVFAMPSNEFFFDFIHYLTIWFTEENNLKKTPIELQRQIFFMRKLWLNTSPGKDPVADQMFHFYQEVPKFFRGYYKCTKQEVISLAALILRARYGANCANLSGTLGDILKEIIPNDVMKMASTAEWKKSIIAAYYNDGEMTPDQAKTRFLEIINEWPMFGSTFFDVKQSFERAYPEKIILAVNKNGIHLIHPQTKDTLISYDFSDMNNWSSGNTFAQLTVGNIMTQKKLLLETPLGYKLDELLTAYTDYFSKSAQKKKVDLYDF